MAGEHILIVDDEPAIRSMLRDVLRTRAIACRRSAAALDALRFFADELPDVTFSTSG
jgi:DNA-binding response OmpR family regulator